MGPPPSLYMYLTLPACLPACPRSDGTEYMAPYSMSRGAAAECSTPLAAQKTPPPGLAELQVGSPGLACPPRGAGECSVGSMQSTASALTASAVGSVGKGCWKRCTLLTQSTYHRLVYLHTACVSWACTLPRLLQADYSIRSFNNPSSLLEEEGWQLAAEATPHPGALGSPGLIAAFPARGGAAAVGAHQSDGSEGSLSAAKTPLLHVNPLAM